MTKTIINLPVPSAAKILVESGDHVTEKTLLAKSEKHEVSEVIHLAKLLGVANSQIAKFLKKKIGEEVSSGDVIAQKRGIFSSSIVRSPITGRLSDLDLTSGMLNLVKYTEEKEFHLLSPIKGKVKEVGKTSLEIEVDNPVFTASSGGGVDTFGELKYIGGNDLGILNITGDVEEKIVLCRSVKDEALIKLSVLGMYGIILLKQKDDGFCCWVTVEENTFGKLAGEDGKKVWLRPKERQIIILE